MGVDFLNCTVTRRRGHAVLRLHVTTRRRRRRCLLHGATISSMQYGCRSLGGVLLCLRRDDSRTAIRTRVQRILRRMRPCRRVAIANGRAISVLLNRGLTQYRRTRVTYAVAISNGLLGFVRPVSLYIVFNGTVSGTVRTYSTLPSPSDHTLDIQYRGQNKFIILGFHGTYLRRRLPMSTLPGAAGSSPRGRNFNLADVHSTARGCNKRVDLQDRGKRFILALLFPRGGWGRESLYVYTTTSNTFCTPIANLCDDSNSYKYEICATVFSIIQSEPPSAQIMIPKPGLE